MPRTTRDRILLLASRVHCQIQCLEDGARDGRGALPVEQLCDGNNVIVIHFVNNTTRVIVAHQKTNNWVLLHKTNE